MKKSELSKMQIILKKRIAEVGKVRDKIRDDISEFESLADDCDQAIDHMERAADALSELA